MGNFGYYLLSMYGDQSSEDLFPVSTPTVLPGTIGASPFNIAVNSTGTFAYVTNNSIDNFAM